MKTEFIPIFCDFILLFIVIMTGINGYQKGFISKVLNLFTWLIALLLAYTFHERLASLFGDWGWTQKLADSITKAITPDMLTPSAEGAETIGKLSSLLPEALRGGIDANNTAAVYSAMGVDSYFDYVGMYLAGMIMKAVAVFLIFTLSSVLLQFLANHLTFVNKIPLVGFVNQLLGFASGAVIAILILQFIMMLLTTLSTIHPVIPSILNVIEQSSIGSLLYRHNIFMNWILAIK